MFKSVNNNGTNSPFRRDFLDLPVRTVQSQTFMETSATKVCFPSLTAKHVLVVSSVKIPAVFSDFLGPIPRLLSVLCFLCAQSVTVSMECVTAVLTVMDSVCVNHRTAGHAATKVRRYKCTLSEKAHII